MGLYGIRVSIVALIKECQCKTWKTIISLLLVVLILVSIKFKLTFYN